MLVIARRLLVMIGKVEVVASVGILVAIVTIILMQVFSRYVLGRPLIWAEELATYLLIWLGFLAASAAYKLRRHITIQSYSGFVSQRVRAFADVLIHSVILVLLVVVSTYVPDAMRTESLKSTVGLPINVGLHWFFSIPTLVSFISMIVTAAFYVLESATGVTRAIIVAPPDPSLNDDIIAIDVAGRGSQ